MPALDPYERLLDNASIRHFLLPYDEQDWPSVLQSMAVLGIQAFTTHYGRTARLEQPSCLRNVASWVSHHGIWPESVSEVARFSDTTVVTPRPRLNGRNPKRRTTSMPSPLFRSALCRSASASLRASPSGALRATGKLPSEHEEATRYKMEECRERLSLSSRSSRSPRLRSWISESIPLGSNSQERRVVSAGVFGPSRGGPVEAEDANCEEWYTTLMSRLQQLSRHREAGVEAGAPSGVGKSADNGAHRSFQIAPKVAEPPEMSRGSAPSLAGLRAGGWKALGEKLSELADGPWAPERGSSERLLSVLPDRGERKENLISKLSVLPDRGERKERALQDPRGIPRFKC